MTTFNPTKTQIDAATELFAWTAALEQAKEIDKNLRQQVLNEGTYHCCPNILEKYEARNLSVPKIIKNTKDDHLIAGVIEIENANTDAARFYSEWDKKMKNSGFYRGMNTISYIDSQLINARRKMFAEVQKMPSIPTIEWDKLTSTLKFYYKFFDLVMSMFASAVNENRDKNLLSQKIWREITNA